MNILLDYFFPITAISPTPEASTAFLKQACVVVEPKGGYGGVTGELVLCTTNAEIAAVTDNVEAQQLLAAGLSRVYLLPVDDLDLADFLEGHEADFYTLLISSDFNDAAITPTQAALTINGDLTFTAVNAGSGGNAITVALVNDDGITAGDEEVEVTGTDIVISIDSGVSTATQIKAAYDAAEDAVELALCTIVDGQGAATQAAAAEAPLAGGDGLYLGNYTGVTGVSSTDDAFLATQAVITNRSAWHTTSGNKAKNMCYAFGKLLSNSLSWLNQQYIEMPLADDVETVGQAETLFDDGISFVISDDEFGERLGFFGVGNGKAIVAPYIIRNLEIDMQSEALSFISGNQPSYTKVNATLLENRLQKVLTEDYVDTGYIEAGTVSVDLEADNFVAAAEIDVAEPGALWRIEAVLRQDL